MVPFIYCIHFIPLLFAISDHVNFHQFDLSAIRRSAFAPGTYANLRTQWSTFLAFAKALGKSWAQPTPDDLSVYSVYLSYHFKAVSTIRNYISGVRTLLLLNNLPVHMFDSLHLHLTLQGLSRLKPHQPRRAAPITPEIFFKNSWSVRFISAKTCSVLGSFPVCLLYILKKEQFGP